MDKKASLFVNIILGSLAAISLVVFFYALYISGYRFSGHMTIYYAASITSVLFFAFILFKCSEDIKAKVSLLTLSSIFSIYAIEILLSYNTKIKSEHVQAKLAEDTGIPYDSRHRIQVWQDLQSKGIDAYPLYNPYDNMEFKNTEILPLGYLSGKTVISCNESGEFIIYKNDEHGFNNPEGLYDGKSIDYVLIGDSFAQGACVKRDENIAGRLMSAGNKVLNLGMLNSGPPKELAILKEYAGHLKPMIVFWLFYEGNDHEGLEFEKKSSLIMKYLNKDFSQDLINKQKLIDEMLLDQLEIEFANGNKYLKLKPEISEKTSLNISLASLKLPQLRKRLGIFVGCESKVDPLFNEIMTEAKRIVNIWNGRLVFVYLPTYERYSEKTNRCRIRVLDTQKNEVMAVIKDLQLPVIDIQNVFDSHSDPLSFFPFRLYGHYNAEGYRLVAENIDKYLSTYRENTEESF